MEMGNFQNLILRTRKNKGLKEISGDFKLSGLHQWVDGGSIRIGIDPCNMDDHL